jgi:hypothetical protein
MAMAMGMLEFETKRREKRFEKLREI